MAKKRRPSKKPDRPLKAASFSSRGEVRVDAESLPREQEALDRDIARRFIIALKHCDDTSLTIIENPEDRTADARLRDVSGEEIELQITECLDEKRLEHRTVALQGGRRLSGAQVTERFRQTIKRKAAKYSAPKGVQFWLLVYTTDFVITEPLVNLNSLATMLRSEAHPFNRVWLFRPGKDDKAGGSLVELFPSCQSTNTASNQGRQGDWHGSLYNAEDIVRSASVRRINRNQNTQDDDSRQRG